MSDPTKKDVNEDEPNESLDAPEIGDAELEQISGGAVQTYNCTNTVTCFKEA
jgi:hypothetical protein